MQCILHVHSALKFEKSAKKYVKKGRDNPLFLTKAKINGKSIQFSACSAAIFCEIEYKNCSRKYKITFISFPICHSRAVLQAAEKARA